jgi:YesN/AraC family two-component response regulator
MLTNKYQSCSLSDNERKALYRRLVELVEREQLYLNPILKLKDLAIRLKTNTRYLSVAINVENGGNLMNFLNNYRIEEVKKKLSTMNRGKGSLTLYGIALTCGFRNKATFYKVFKDLTDITPLDYMNDKSSN